MALKDELRFWTPEPIWRGETAFVLAGGPSMSAAIAEKVRGRRTIAVNSTALIAPGAEILFFTDTGWYEPRRTFVRQWPGMVVTLSRIAKAELGDRVHRIRGIGDPTRPLKEFPRPGSGVAQGRSSGHTAVALAIALGAAAVVMLGFDMRVVGGREHHHEEYSGPRDLDVYARDFVPGFAGWNAAAHAIGVQVLNATPESAVGEFPFADLDEVL